MCGFVAGNFFNDQVQFRESLDLISHRGMDSQDILYIPETDTFLGHNRLSIQGLNSGANQPMVLDPYVLVYNGELWKSMNGYKEQYPLTTGSDTELLIHLYKDQQERCIQELDGMFGFAIYNKEKSEIIFSRDFMGRIPLYYYNSAQRIIISSELKSITHSLDINSSEVSVVEPGCYYKFNIKTGSLVKTRFYHYPDMNQIKDLEEEQITGTIRRLLDKAVDNELISDVPICTILSGGVDSSVITYLLSQRIPNLQAFVVSLGDTGKKDDLYYARMASKEFGIPLNEVIIDKQYVEDNLSDAVYAIEDHKWTQVSPAVAQLALSRAIKERGFKVVFGGEGSDELFASYGDVFAWHYKDDDYIKKRYKLITELHKNNLIRTNKAMMYGGTVELRTPFLDKELVEFCLSIPPKYKKDGNMWKPMLRKAFKGEISDELLFRTKKTFQEGCHTSFLKEQKDQLKEYYSKHYEQMNSLDRFMS